MRAGFLACTAALLLICSAAFGKTDFSGNRAFSSGELNHFLQWPDSLAGDSASKAIRLRAMTDSLLVKDYLFAGVDSSRWMEDGRGAGRFRIFLHEGKIPQVRRIRWLGDSLAALAPVARRAMTVGGGTFHWSNLDYDCNAILDAFERAGYPFAQVELSSVETDESANVVDADLVLRSGPLTTVDYLAFPGNRLTSEVFLRRETRLRTGSGYDQRKVNAADRHLARLDFIRRNGKTRIAARQDGKTGLAFPVQETKSTRLDAAAGYLPAVAGRGALWTGLVNVEFLNLFGSGRRARIHWDRPDKKRQSAEVSYREPWVLGLPFALRFDFGQRIEDTTYVSRKLSLQADLDLSGSVQVWGALRQESVITDSQSAAANNLPSNRTLLLESGMTYDIRDHPTNPRTGVLFSTFAATGWRKRDQAGGTEPAGSFRQNRAGVDCEMAQEIFPYWIADVALHARALETTEPQALVPDLFRIGGARTLRGYREEQFMGSRAGWASAEIRYWLGTASRLAVFCDAGSVYRDQILEGMHFLSTLFRTGAGFGLRMETALGVWGFDYGVGQDDKPLTGKIHVSLLSTF